MKFICASMLISTIGIMPFSSMNAAQELKVCITVDASKKLRRDNIPLHELDKWGRFYGQQAEPFQYYFPVLSARYEDCLSDGIILHKNFLKKLPSIIYNDQNLSKDERKKYRFPKYISQSFITQLQDDEGCGRKFQHRFYKHKDLKKTLTISYIIEYQQRDNQTGAENCLTFRYPLIPLACEQGAQDYVVDLMALLSLFIG